MFTSEIILIFTEVLRILSERWHGTLPCITISFETAMKLIFDGMPFIYFWSKSSARKSKTSLKHVISRSANRHALNPQTYFVDQWPVSAPHLPHSSSVVTQVSMIQSFVAFLFASEFLSFTKTRQPIGCQHIPYIRGSTTPCVHNFRFHAELGVDYRLNWIKFPYLVMVKFSLEVARSRTILKLAHHQNNIHREKYYYPAASFKTEKGEEVVCFIFPNVSNWPHLPMTVDCSH